MSLGADAEPASRETKATAMPPSTETLTERRHLILHIGSGKTGTSSIQFFLRDNRDRLAELGVFYPGSPGSARHARLGLFIRSDAELENHATWRRQDYASPAEFREQFEHEFLTEIERVPSPRVLLSDEAIYGCSAGVLKRLRALTDRVAKSLHLVVYLRRQDDHLVSRYQQVVKVGETRRLADRTRELNLSSTYDYRKRLRVLQDLLEPTRFVVRRFERDRFVDGSLLQDFLEAADIDARAEDWDQVPPRNESLDAECVEFLRLLNVTLAEHDNKHAGLIDQRKLANRLQGVSSGPTLTMSDSLLDEFMAQWEEGNRAVAREYFDDMTGELFRTARKSGNTTTVQYLDPDRLELFLSAAELPADVQAPLRRVVEREARIAVAP